MNKSIFYEKKAGNSGISSETTRESRVRRPGNLEWDIPFPLEEAGSMGSLATANGIPKDPIGVLEAQIPRRSYTGIPRYPPGEVVPGRLTRDSRVSGLFFVNKSGKSFFRTPGTNIKFWIFYDFFYMTSISYINPYFLAPSPLKPLKSRPQGQNLPGFLLRAHSDHRGPV